jgi:3',5'-cyclic-AMP phosphodiesterase
MLWAGTGVVWTVAGGVPASGLIGSAKAAESSFSFVQISDSHISFAKPANPDVRVTPSTRRSTRLQRCRESRRS